MYMCVDIYQVNKDCEYPKNEGSMRGYLIQNIPAEQKNFSVKIQENKRLYSMINLFCFFKLIFWNPSDDFEKRKKFLMEYIF